MPERLCGIHPAPSSATTQPHDPLRLRLRSEAVLRVSSSPSSPSSRTDKSVELLEPERFRTASLPRDLRTYLEYLGFYVKDGSEHSNAEAGKTRKLATLRSFYEYMFKSELIHTDVSRLVEMPKKHEKPILRTGNRRGRPHARRGADRFGADRPRGRRPSNESRPSARDLAILTLFLGTGIRVSELCRAGSRRSWTSRLNSFLVTRKGGNQAILYFPDEVAQRASGPTSPTAREMTSPARATRTRSFYRFRTSAWAVRAVAGHGQEVCAAAPRPSRSASVRTSCAATFGTNLYHETGDIYLVADVLGHSGREHHPTTLRRHVRRPAAHGGEGGQAARRPRE